MGFLRQRLFNNIILINLYIWIIERGIKMTMRSIIRRFYLFGVLFSIIVAVSLFYQFQYFSTILSNETETLTTQSRKLAASEINRSLVSKAQVIQDAADYLSTKEWKKVDTLAYLARLLNNNPLFSSIYFGSVDNRLINASGWVEKSVDSTSTISTNSIV